MNEQVLCMPNTMIFRENVTFSPKGGEWGKMLNDCFTVPIFDPLTQYGMKEYITYIKAKCHEFLAQI